MVFQFNSGCYVHVIVLPWIPGHDAMPQSHATWESQDRGKPAMDVVLQHHVLVFINQPCQEKITMDRNYTVCAYF